MILSKDDRGRVIRGQVLYHNQWVPIEEKEAKVKAVEKRLEEGYVVFQGEWITIDEKLARIQAAQTPPQPVQPQQNVYYQTLNRQTYNVQNIDNRTYQDISHEHRHLHLDPNALPPNWQQSLLNQGDAQHGAQQIPQQPPLQQIPPSQQQPQRLLERQLPREAPDYFYGEEDEPEGDSEQKPES